MQAVSASALHHSVLLVCPDKYVYQEGVVGLSTTPTSVALGFEGPSGRDRLLLGMAG